MVNLSVTCLCHFVIILFYSGLCNIWVGCLSSIVLIFHFCWYISDRSSNCILWSFVTFILLRMCVFYWAMICLNFLTCLNIPLHSFYNECKGIKTRKQFFVFLSDLGIIEESILKLFPNNNLSYFSDSCN